MAFVRIETKRLILRGYSANDLASVTALWAPEMTRFNGGPVDAATVAGKVDLYISQWTLLGYGFWAVEDRGGTYVGHVGISHTPGSIEPKIGWAFLPAHQGRGYATEAVEAALD